MGLNCAMRFLGPGLDLSSCGFHWKKPIRNNCELCFPTQSGGCSSMTQSVAASSPASTLAVVVFIGKNQFAIIANCFFPHNLVSAIASMESVAATAPASTSAVSCVFHRKKNQFAIIANCLLPHNLVAATADTHPGPHSPCHRLLRRCFFGPGGLSSQGQHHLRGQQAR